MDAKTLSVIRELASALSDIRNAADNGEPYTNAELQGDEFGKPVSDAYELLKRHEIELA